MFPWGVDYTFAPVAHPPSSLYTFTGTLPALGSGLAYLSPELAFPEFEGFITLRLPSGRPRRVRRVYQFRHLPNPFATVEMKRPPKCFSSNSLRF
jgi:hypothetical protein